MKLFGRRKLWYLTQFAKFQYRIGRGDALQGMVLGKIKALAYGVITLGTGEIVISKWFDVSILDHIPWWALVFILPIITTALDYFFGWLDEKKINLMQIEAEIMMRRQLNPWEYEKMEMV